jgi:SAM-dependent methyltransferase
MQYLSSIEPSAPFEQLYLKIRRDEGRVLDDTTVAMLPDVSKEQVPNYKDWQARAASFKRLKRYFDTALNGPKELLDVGCGNGWAAGGLADNKLLNVSAVDVNLQELQQAERVFRAPNLAFYYGDIFGDIFPRGHFDFIVLNASEQYFSDLQGLVERLFFFLKADGEIHIVDTPFYGDEEVAAAKERSRIYFDGLGVPQMAEHYFHHRLSDLSGFKYEILNSAGLWDTLRARFVPSLPRHFRWIRIKGDASEATK